MWKNPHVVGAMLAAPVLALLAYFAVDALVGEPATPAQAGANYPLVVAPGCRRVGGRCQVSNAELTLAINATAIARERYRITISSSHEFDRVLLGTAEPDATGNTPTELQRGSADSRDWVGTVAITSPDRHLAIAAGRDGSWFYAEVPTTFINQFPAND